jgi:hypothetical protein
MSIGDEIVLVFASAVLYQGIYLMFPEGLFVRETWVTGVRGHG